MLGNSFSRIRHGELLLLCHRPLRRPLLFRDILAISSSRDLFRSVAKQRTEAGLATSPLSCSKQRPDIDFSQILSDWHCSVYGLPIANWSVDCQDRSHLYDRLLSLEFLLPQTSFPQSRGAFALPLTSPDARRDIRSFARTVFVRHRQSLTSGTTKGLRRLLRPSQHRVAKNSQNGHLLEFLSSFPPVREFYKGT